MVFLAARKSPIAMLREGSYVRLSATDVANLAPSAASSEKTLASSGPRIPDKWINAEFRVVGSRGSPCRVMDHRRGILRIVLKHAYAIHYRFYAIEMRQTVRGRCDLGNIGSRLDSELAGSALLLRGNDL